MSSTELNYLQFDRRSLSVGILDIRCLRQKPKSVAVDGHRTQSWVHQLGRRLPKCYATGGQCVGFVWWTTSMAVRSSGCASLLRVREGAILIRLNPGKCIRPIKYKVLRCPSFQLEISDRTGLLGKAQGRSSVNLDPLQNGRRGPQSF